MVRLVGFVIVRPPYARPRHVSREIDRLVAIVMGQARMLHASAATAGTCPFPAARARSIRWARPSETRKRSPSGRGQIALADSCTRATCASTVPTGSPCGLASPRSHHRCRTCGAPRAAADTWAIEVRYPMARRSRAASRIGFRTTFSAKTYRGRTSPTIRRIWCQRSTATDRPRVAGLQNWHGKPPLTTSHRPRHGRPSNVQTSFHTGKRSRSPSRWRARRSSRG